MKAKMLLTLAFVVSSLVFTNAHPVSEKRVVCYQGTWAVYRPGNGKFDVSKINPSLCTHLIYAFVGVNENGTLALLDAELDVGHDNLKKFVQLKKQNKNLKVLVAMGGWNEGSTKYSAVAADADLRATFVKSVLIFIQENGFDGFDLDWEYPAQRGGSKDDFKNYITLLQELRDAFKPHNLLLTAAASASASSVDTSYDVKAMTQILDFVSIMAYDLHGTWDGVTGQNAPLFASSNDTTEAARQLNIAGAINVWLKRGADPSRLVLGLATYGRSFTLNDTSKTYIGAPINGAGNAGPYTREAGTLGYNEICRHKLQPSGWTFVWDDEQKVPYEYNGNQWVGYDNARSIALKVKYALKKKLSGVMVWSIETDDFRGVCSDNGDKYPLLTAINKAIKSA